MDEKNFGTLTDSGAVNADADTHSEPAVLTSGGTDSGTKSVPGQIVFAVSGKGGTGKTMTSAGVTSCLAALGCPVLLIDADIGLRNVDIVLGLTDKAVMDLGDVLDGSARLEDAVLEHPSVAGLWVLPSPARPRDLDADEFSRMIASLRGRFRFIWIDGPAGYSDWVRRLSDMSDKIVLVTTPDTSSLRDAARMTELLDASGGRGALIVNRVRPHLIRHNGAMFVDDIMDGTGLPLLGLIPEDERVIVAGNKGVPLVTLGQDGAAVFYRDIALRLLGERVPLGDVRMTGKAKRDFMRRFKRNG